MSSKYWDTVTYESFRASYGSNQYRGPQWRNLLGCLPGYGYLPNVDRKGWRGFQWYRLAFTLHIRVPNAAGFFADGPEAIGASWCLPWNWYRRYYGARVLPLKSKP